MKLIKEIYRLFINVKQKTYQVFCVAIVSLAALFCMNATTFAGTIYVDGSLTPCGDGEGWSTAYRYLQDALFNAFPGDQIFVRAGTYRVDQRCGDDALGSGERDETFLLKDGVKLRGGFAGTESFAIDRELEGNPTILSGELFKLPPTCEGGPDAVCCDDVCAVSPYCCEGDWDEYCGYDAALLCGEAYHVVTTDSDIDNPLTTFIERFTIQDGVANGAGINEIEGAGMLVLGDPGIIRCEFTKNVAYIGSGMSIKSGSNPIIVNCVFNENPPNGATVSAVFGGGLANTGGIVQITNSLFYDNIVRGSGGAIYNIIGTCLGEPCGGIIDLVNCTIVDNEAGKDGKYPSTGFGGGVFNTGGAYIDADNCIFYFNVDDSASVEAAQITETVLAQL